MDLLSDVLMRFHFSGTLYFRTSFTSPWGVEVPAYQNVMRFHFAHKGRCLVHVRGLPDPIALEQGDLVIIPRGASHRLYCDPKTADQVLPLDRVLELSGFDGTGALVYGGDDDDRDTQLICGHFAFDPLLQHPLLDRLPPILHLTNYGEMAGKWMEYTLRMIGQEAGRAEMGGDLIAVKMSEIIFAQAIRAFIADQGDQHIGLAAFADPQIARALTAVHATPGANWTVARLSEIAAMSRTAFSQRFADLMGATPMNYVTDWRMQLARQALAKGTDGLAQIGEDIGYASEAAFARVFKKRTGQTPGSFRRHPR